MNKPSQITPQGDAAEYRIVRRDLIFVIIMNLSFLALLLALYFYNHSTGRVDTFFSHILKFQ